MYYNGGSVNIVKVSIVKVNIVKVNVLKVNILKVNIVNINNPTRMSQQVEMQYHTRISPYNEASKQSFLQLKTLERILDNPTYVPSSYH